MQRLTYDEAWAVLRKLGNGRHLRTKTDLRNAAITALAKRRRQYPVDMQDIERKMVDLLVAGKFDLDKYPASPAERADPNFRFKIPKAKTSV